MKLKNKIFSIYNFNVVFAICSGLDLVFSLLVIDGKNVIEINFLLSFYNEMALTILGILLFVFVYVMFKFAFIFVINIFYLYSTKTKSIKIFYFLVIVLHIYAIINNILLGVKFGFVF